MKQLPKYLHEITLSKWVEYQNLYGQALDDRAIAIRKLTGEDKQNAMLLHQFDQFCQQYAFYTSTPLAEIMKLEMADVIPILKLQGENNVSLKKQELALDIYAVKEWNGEQWQIQTIMPYTVNLTPEQFEHNQDVALILSDLQDGKHEALYDLCATYLRHPGEKYTTELMESRIELMKELPLSISLCVKNFLEIMIAKTIKSPHFKK